MSSQAEQRAATADLQSSSTGPSQTAAGPVVNTTAQAVQAPPPGTVSNGDGSRPIRRTKASRACDNCRRRKVCLRTMAYGC